MVPIARRAGARLIQQERTNGEYKDGAGGGHPAGLPSPLPPPRPLIPFSRRARSVRDKPTDIGRWRRRALLVHEFLSVDVTQALEEGQGAERVGVSNLHIARHSLDHSHEALQFRHDVIWGQKSGSDGGGAYKMVLKGSNLQLRLLHESLMQTSQRVPPQLCHVQGIISTLAAMSQLR